MTKFSYFRLKYGEILDAGASNAVAAENKPPQVCTDQYYSLLLYNANKPLRTMCGMVVAHFM